MSRESKSDHKIAVIVPAYNEGPRIGAVLDVLVKVDHIDEIIVVDDGSEDETASAASKHHVKVIRMESNKGKGAAMRKGADSTDADILLFIDADLVGLKPGHIDRLISPLIETEEIEMSVARFTEGRLSTNLSQRIAPILNSQRAIRRTFLDRVPEFSSSRFGVETIITTYARRSKAKVIEVEFEGVTQVMKEEKIGKIKGMKSRLDMYKDVIKHRYARSKTD